MTNEDTLNDNVGDGTFVAGVIVGKDAKCLGLLLCLREYVIRVQACTFLGYCLLCNGVEMFVLDV